MGLSCFANESSTFLQEQDCCEAKGHSYILGHGKKSQMDIWDREYMELIGIGAAELYDKHNQRRGEWGNFNSIPDNTPTIDTCDHNSNKTQAQVDAYSYILNSLSQITLRTGHVMHLCYDLVGVSASSLREKIGLADFEMVGFDEVVYLEVLGAH
nr:hypothetical protein Iba_chr03aCG21960 [Ipomoea batatas]